VCICVLGQFFSGVGACIYVCLCMCEWLREKAREREKTRETYSVFFYLCCICACMFVQ